VTTLVAPSPLEAVLSRFQGRKPAGADEWDVICPVHDDHRPSLGIGLKADHIVFTCRAGCPTNSILAAVGLSMTDLFLDSSAKASGHSTNGRRERSPVVATYDYVDEHDRLLFQVQRLVNKEFPQRRPDGYGGWIYKLGDTRRVPYRLPRIIEAVALGRRVYVVEGEKDVHSLERLGATATTNPGGAGRGKWRDEYSQILAGADVVVLPDNDDKGKEHAAAIARSLAVHGCNVRVVELPSIPAKGDVTDWTNAGGTLPQLEALVDITPPIDPTSKPEESSETKEMRVERESRPDILIRPELSAMTDEVIAAIGRRPDLDVFVRARMLVTYARDGSHPDTWLRRPPGSPVIVPIEQAAMLDIMDRVVTWWKADGRKGESGRSRAMPPSSIASQVLARRAWPFPYLEGVTETPTLRRDGTVFDSPGHDEASGFLFVPAIGANAWPSIPSRPSAAEAKTAVHTLKEPFVNFPFVSETDRSAAITAVLSIVARSAIDGPVPACPVRAPTPGTGKSLLASAISVISTGREPAVMAMADADELRKRITSLALAGTPTVLLDNLSGSVGSDVLASAITSTSWEDRLLGRSEMVSLPLRTVWLLTGNNLGFTKTFGRRVVPIDLDAKVEHPEDRTNFKFPNLLAHIHRNRPRYVAAALTILRGFVVAGKPPHGKSRLGSFEAWDDLVRSAVVWAGLDDPASTDNPNSGRGRIRAQRDDDVEDLLTLYRELARVFANNVGGWTASDAWKRRDFDPDLRLAVDLAAAPRKDRGKPATLAGFRYLLRGSVDRPIGRFRLGRISSDDDREAVWQIAQTEAAP
jgi:putative DNA primase/helicase